MSVQSLYSAEMRHQLKVFPIWQPGDPVSVGDVGTLRKGVFEKQTTLKALFPRLQLVHAKARLDRPYRFRSRDCVVSEAKVSGAVGGNVANVEATASFGRRGGVMFDAAGITRGSIDNLLDVKNFIQARKDEWPAGTALVVSIDACEQFKLVVSEAGNALIKLEGSAMALSNFAIADPSVNVSVEGAASYSTHGSGAVAAVVYGFGWFGYFQPKRLELFGDETVAPEGEFEELSADAFPEE